MKTNAEGLRDAGLGGSRSVRLLGDDQGPYEVEERVIEGVERPQEEADAVDQLAARRGSLDGR